MSERVFHEYLQEVCEPSEVRISVLLSLGAYQRGDGVNFAIFSHQATWRVVDPILRNVTPVHEYKPNTWE